MTRFAIGSFMLGATLGISIPQAAVAVPFAVDPTITSISTFDTAGFLDLPSSGFVLGGLEVDPVTGTVYVLASDAPAGGTSTAVVLISSTGLGTAAPVAPPVPFKLNARGFDLTLHPVDGKYYAAGTLFAPLAPIDGIHGFDPLGISPPTTFAVTTSGFATSGLTFDALGTTALVSTDGVDIAVLPNGLYSVPVGGPEVTIVTSGPLPVGIPAGTDDHVVTLGGSTIIAGDGIHDFWDATGGAGTVSLLIDLDTIPAVVPELGVGGNRAALDPWSGDIFYGHALTPGSFGIVRVKADGSGATVFASGFMGLRDFDVGPASSGGGMSLYVTEVDLGMGGIGSIYEIEYTHPIPEPSTMILGLAGILALAISRRRFTQG